MDDTYIKRISFFANGQGKIWLKAIPSLIKEYEEKWSFSALPPFTLSYNYVAPVILSDNTSAVIKIGFPWDKEFLEGVEALQIYNGEGSVKLYQFNKEDSIALLEKVEPGVSLQSVQKDEEATRIAANVMKRLWKNVPPDHNLSSVADWGKAFEQLRKAYGGSGPLPKEMFTSAEKVFFDLLQSASENVVLHGDLHHDNILSTTRGGWLAIDPKGIIGEREYEIGAFLRNPRHIYAKDNVKDILSKRIAIFSEELNLDRTRISQWAFSQAVLSAIWSIEEKSEDWKIGIAFAEVLETI